ncbi:MAG TPA: signal peptide peptidase SppA, partial [Pseudohongiella sp.]|nr:signal peptide peptidase SppA [Pseudohongiella sp.]
MRRFFSGLGRLIDGLMTITGRIIFLLVLAFVLLLIFSSPATVTVPSTSALVWAPTGVISEQRSP